MSESPPPRAWKSIAWALLLVTSLLGIATTRVIILGESHLEACDAALRKQDFAVATVEARTAASLYVPGVPHVDAAYARLLHIARTTEANSDKDAALFAWQAMRTSAIDTRAITQPHERELMMADTAIARLSSQAPRPLMSRDQTPEQAERHMRDLLAKEDAPRAPWAVTLVVGFAAMIGGLVMALRKGLDQPRFLERARLPLIVSSLGLLLYAFTAARLRRAHVSASSCVTDVASPPAAPAPAHRDFARSASAHGRADA